MILNVMVRLNFTKAFLPLIEPLLDDILADDNDRVLNGDIGVQAAREQFERRAVQCVKYLSALRVNNCYSREHHHPWI